MQFGTESVRRWINCLSARETHLDEATGNERERSVCERKVLVLAHSGGARATPSVFVPSSPAERNVEHRTITTLFRPGACADFRMTWRWMPAQRGARRRCHYTATTAATAKVPLLAPMCPACSCPFLGTNCPRDCQIGPPPRSQALPSPLSAFSGVAAAAAAVEW